METLDQFVAAWNGRFAQAPGGIGGQCVDLTELWRINLGGQRIYRNAKDFAGLPIAGMTWIANTPTNVPDPGDVVVWQANPESAFGHIAVFLSGDALAFESFDQDYPFGSPCHRQQHNYRYVAGWQRPDVLHPPPPTPAPSPGPGDGAGTPGPFSWLIQLWRAIRRWLGLG